VQHSKYVDLLIKFRANNARRHEGMVGRVRKNCVATLHVPFVQFDLVQGLTAWEWTDDFQELRANVLQRDCIKAS
jgi:hypothetical protein